MNNTKNTGERIRDLVGRKGLKVRDFAILCGITPQTASKILNNKHEPSLKLVSRMAEILNTTPEYILCESDTSYNYENNDAIRNDLAKGNSLLIGNVIRFLSVMGYSVTEKIIINNIEFSRNCNSLFCAHATQDDLLFCTCTTQSNLLKHGFISKDSIRNSKQVAASYMTYKCTEEILAQKISQSSLSVIHCYDIYFQGSCKTLSESEFMTTLHSLISIIKSFLDTVVCVPQDPFYTSKIEKAYQKHALESCHNLYECTDGNSSTGTK